MHPNPGKIEEIASDVFALIWSEDDSVYGGYGANQGFVILENSVLLFDSGLTLVQARQLEKEVRRVSDKKIRYLVNSHDHSDHVFGNSFFWNKYFSAGLRILSHRVCRDNMVSLGPKRLVRYSKIAGLRASLQQVRIREPDVTYSDPGLRIDLEGTNFVFVHPPTGAHTLGDTLLYLPDKKAIFAGDIVWNRFMPNLEDANIEGWISFLDELDLSICKKIVPGHGKVCGPNTVFAFREYLQLVRSNLMKVDLAKTSRRDRNLLKSCFMTQETDDWKLRSIIHHNVDTILVRRSGT